jgi:ATP phosphoribosyltransferase regulatory subunit HisZ
MAGKVADRAQDMAGKVGDRAKDMAHTAGQRAEDYVHRAGSAMEQLGDTIREHAPQGGTFGGVGSRVADNLASGGRYLQEEGISGLADDVTDMIRRNPIPALFIGIGLGYLVARATSRS